MRTWILLWACCLVAVVAASCGEDGTGPEKTTPVFGLALTVTDPGGAPVANLRIAAWNDLTLPMPRVSSPAATSALPAATMVFSLDRNAQVFMWAENVADEIVDSLLSGGILVAGSHQILWSPELPSGVYKIVLLVRDPDGGGELFRDSVWAVLYRLDANVFGYTSTAGKFSDNDKTRFPNLFDLPPLNSRDVTCTPGQTFAHLDSITILLTDTLTTQTQAFRAAIADGANNLNLVWNPSPTLPRPLRLSNRPLAIGRRENAQPAEFNLNGPCPNPFN